MSHLAEALQRSLLTPPPRRDDLEIAVRYLPAMAEAHVGGDWYDAFSLPDGATGLAIGDVAGHDRNAAAAMAQVRNLLRGTAYALGEPPAAVLAALDRALWGLDVDGLVTTAMARLEAVGARRAAGSCGRAPGTAAAGGPCRWWRRAARPLIVGGWRAEGGGRYLATRLRSAAGPRGWRPAGRR